MNCLKTLKLSMLMMVIACFAMISEPVFAQEAADAVKAAGKTAGAVVNETAEAVKEAVEEAAPAAEISGADTAFMLVCAALVLLMTPGLAFFYGGLVRRKNVLSVLMQCFMCMCLMTVLWVALGYSLAFSEGSLFIGGFDYAFYNGVGLEANGSIPHILFATFQGMFAIITPALFIGAFAERMKFSGFCVFSSLWLLVRTPAISLTGNSLWRLAKTLGALPSTPTWRACPTCSSPGPPARASRWPSTP